MTTAIRSLMLGFLICALPGCSGGSTDNNATAGNEPDNHPAPATGSADSPPLWRIETAGANAWLLATMPTGVNRNDGLPPQVLELFDNASLVVADYDRNAGNNPETGREYLLALQKLSRLPVNESLEAKLPLEAFNQLVARISRHPAAQGGGDLRTALAGLQPWAVHEQLLRVVTDTAETTTNWLLVRAGRNSDTTLAFLEPAAERFARMAQMPYDVWLDGIKRMLKEPAAMTEMKAAAKAWRTGDLKGLAAWRAAAAERQPEVDRTLVAGRTASWIGQLPQHIARGAFIIVSAEHVVGPDNLIDQLQAAGYTLTRQ